MAGDFDKPPPSPPVRPNAKSNRAGQKDNDIGGIAHLHIDHGELSVFLFLLKMIVFFPVKFVKHHTGAWHNVDDRAAICRRGSRPTHDW